MLMDDGHFQWDDRKAAANARDHGVTFNAARAVFHDPFAVEWIDERERYDEDRHAIIGMVENRLLYVAFTMRGEKIRIISARKAEPHERRLYHEENRS
jgi:uncharacterized protein